MPINKKSIQVIVENIDDPTDIKKFNSIHQAMKNYKKSFKTIKDYIMNNRIINGFKWRTNIQTQTIINIEEELNRIDTDLQKLETELNEPLEEEVEKELEEANYIIYPYQLEPIQEIKETIEEIIENTEELDYIETPKEELSYIEPIKIIHTPCVNNSPEYKYKQRDQCVCKIM
jgi:DNA repair exonuclease SbcCD ATPase subunit